MAAFSYGVLEELLELRCEARYMALEICFDIVYRHVVLDSYHTYNLETYKYSRKRLDYSVPKTRHRNRNLPK